MAKDELTSIRNHFQEEEELTAEQAATYYSDSKLLAVLRGDPETYDKWRRDAFKAACKNIPVF